ncbi:MAG: small subunit ribosomal protein S17 [Parcubacteria group bacterium Gr01-1014_38]|nr:MAG: small subunit ribosomal protein S17 [Parcubacteria group bacterium Gr01-1014_38]
MGNRAKGLKRTPSAGGGSIGGGTKAVPTRAHRKQFFGTVVSAGKMARTVTVAVERLPWHPTLKHQIRRRTKFLVDDPKHEARIGDQVVIEETRPLSRRKHFRLLRIVSRARAGTVATSPDVSPTQREAA